VIVCNASDASRPMKTDRDNMREWKIKIDKGEGEGGSDCVGGRANERMVLCWNSSVKSSCNYPRSLALFLTFRVWSTIWVVLLYHWYLISLSKHTDHSLLIHSLKGFFKIQDFYLARVDFTFFCFFFAMWTSH